MARILAVFCYCFCMTVIESILEDLKGLPNAKLVQVASYVRGLNKSGHEERLKLLGETFGGLSEEDGKAFDEALAESRRIEP
jgi:hypothetical protein